MSQKLKEKIMEALSSVLPVSAIVLVLSFTLTPMPIGTLLLFLLGAAMLIVGMGFFSLGADMAMMPMGDSIGGTVTKTRHHSIAMVICFLIGAAVTIAEPDLKVLARQVPAVPDLTIILTVAAGVGVFLVVAMLRSRLALSLSRMLIVLYILLFVLAFFVPREFLAVAFDAGGVTTGPITVPFLMALGVGAAAMRGGNNTEEDSFGLVALCSVGPILAVLILGIAYQSTDIAYTPFTVPEVFTSQEAAQRFTADLPVYLEEVLFGLAPIVAIFALVQLVSTHLGRRPLIKISVGTVYTFIGLTLFLTGANVGFMPAGNFIGEQLAALPQRWLMVPIGMVIGYFLVAAEPAVHVLTKQVEEVTDGAIPQKAIRLSLSIGVSVSVGLAMLRVLIGLPILYILIPGYAVALVLTRFVPEIFTAVAFDSGGVASGPMTATFLLPFAMGACLSVGGNVLTDAFGVVALVAMTPLVTIQVLGLFYNRKLRNTHDLTPIEEAQLDDSIVEYTD